MRRSIITGVPQGSILGPLLFLIYINDIENCTNLFNLLGFADDTTLYGNVKRFAAKTAPGTPVRRTINNEISKVSDWLAVNKLSLNIGKTKHMHFYFHQSWQNTGVNLENLDIIGLRLEILGQQIDRVKKFNLLGIFLTSTLSWKAHTDYVSNKMSKNVGILNCLKRFLPFSVRKMLYNTLVHSYLNNGILVWGFAPDRLIVLQKKAVRAVMCANYNSHTEPIFKELKIVKVEDLLILRCLKFYYWYKNNELPIYFNNMFEIPMADHAYNTRDGNRARPNRTRTVAASKCLRYFIPDSIMNYDNQVLDKILTHSPDGFSTYAKNFIISNYSTTCDNPNSCNTCAYQRLREQR